MQAVDQVLCSEGCPCYFDKESTKLYEENATFAPFFNLWNTSDIKFMAKNFDGCPAKLRYFAYEEAMKRNPKLDPEGNFDIIKFAEYFQHVESTFHCTGWCRLNYFNPDYQKFVTIGKYLFTNVNGPNWDHSVPPPYLGCFDVLMAWLPGYLIAWGAIVLCGVSCQVFLVGLGIHKLIEVWDQKHHPQSYMRKDSPTSAENLPVRVEP